MYAYVQNCATLRTPICTELRAATDDCSTKEESGRPRTPTAESNVTREERSVARSGKSPEYEAAIANGLPGMCSSLKRIEIE